MPEGQTKPDGQGRRLTVDFAGWLGNEASQPELFFRKGLIVLDANVLLDLYRVTPDARSQIIGTLNGVAERLWVPHQAAVEFSRNRKRVIEERTSSFKRTKQVLQSATVKAPSIGKRPGCHPETVRRQLHRFNAEGINGLGDRPVPRLTEAECSRIIALVKMTPPG